MKIIKLEAERQTEEKKETVKGVQFLVSLSPYFFPEELECEYKEESGCLVINFKYLDEESKEEAKKCVSRGKGLVSVWVGKHTDRLLSLHIKVDKHDINRVEMSVIDEAYEALEEVQKSNPDMEENYEVAEQALRAHSREISELVSA